MSEPQITVTVRCEQAARLVLRRAYAFRGLSTLMHRGISSDFCLYLRTAATSCKLLARVAAVRCTTCRRYTLRLGLNERVFLADCTERFYSIHILCAVAMETVAFATHVFIYRVRLSGCASTPTPMRCSGRPKVITGIDLGQSPHSFGCATGRAG